jgi:hypothetical protein
MDDERQGGGARDPRLFARVDGKWESFSQVKPIRMGLEGAGREDIIDHLESLEKVYQVRLRNADAIFQTAHGDYVSFRFLQWALISILIVSIFGFFGLALLLEWQPLLIVVAMCVVLSITVPLIALVNSQKRKLLTVLARYLQNYYKEDLIAGVLLQVWAREHRMMRFEDRDYALDDGFRKEVEEEMVRTILYLSIGENMGRLTPEEQQIVDRAKAHLPSDVIHTITMTVNEALYDKITTAQKRK